VRKKKEWRRRITFLLSREKGTMKEEKHPHRKIILGRGSGKKEDRLPAPSFSSSIANERKSERKKGKDWL